MPIQKIIPAVYIFFTNCSLFSSDTAYLRYISNLEYDILSLRAVKIQLSGGEKMGGVGSVLNNIGSSVSNAVNTAGQAVSGGLNTAGQDVSGGLNTAGQDVSGGLNTAGQDVSGGLNTAGQDVSGGLNTAGQDLANGSNWVQNETDSGTQWLNQGADQRIDGFENSSIGNNVAGHALGTVAKTWVGFNTGSIAGLVSTGTSMGEFVGAGLEAGSGHGWHPLSGEVGKLPGDLQKDPAYAFGDGAGMIAGALLTGDIGDIGDIGDVGDAVDALNYAQLGTDSITAGINIGQSIMNGALNITQMGTDGFSIITDLA